MLCEYGKRFAGIAIQKYESSKLWHGHIGPAVAEHLEAYELHSNRNSLQNLDSTISHRRDISSLQLLHSAIVG